jgi:hypothetical protein
MRTAKKAADMGGMLLAYIDWASKDISAPVPAALAPRDRIAHPWWQELRGYVQRDIDMLKRVGPWVLDQQKAYSKHMLQQNPVHPPPLSMLPTPAISWAMLLAGINEVLPRDMGTNVQQNQLLIDVFQDVQTRGAERVPASWSKSYAYPHGGVDLWLNVVAGVPLSPDNPCTLQMPRSYEHVYYWIAQYDVSPCIPREHASYITLSSNAAHRASPVQDRSGG